MENSPVFVRAADPGDLDAIVDVHTQGRTAYYRAGGLSLAEIDGPDGPAQRRAGWTRAIRSSARTVLCAVHVRAVVGVVAMGPPLSPGADAASVGELYQIHVLPGHWGQGVGGQLHAAFVRFLRDTSLPIGQVEVWERNHRAQAFYARHGWRPNGPRRQGPDASGYVRMRLGVGVT